VSQTQVRECLRRWFDAGVAAADPTRRVAESLARQGSDLVIAGEIVPEAARVFLFAAGKAAAPMAAAAEQALGERLHAGLAITKTGHGVPLQRTALREAGHPVPDRQSEEAGEAAVNFTRQASPRDVLVVLLSGGASSLLACPIAGLTQGDIAQTTRVLLESGAPIEELNAVRKRLVATGGGRLTEACPASRIHVLVLSDVAGDAVDVVGSGPFAPDPTTYADAWAVLVRRDLLGEVPAAVRRQLEAGCRGARPETPDADSPGFDRVQHLVLANNETALVGVEAAIRADGRTPVRVTEALRGEAREVGVRLAALARATTQIGTCLVAGGETTVTVRGDGRGGRSQELALAAALALEGSPVALLAAGTDGTDGPTDAAGAIIDGETLERARSQGIDASDCLERNDAHSFFSKVGGLVETGPTGTNVMDLVIIDPFAGV
jgi:hydroxypyruvate reductase